MRHRRYAVIRKLTLRVMGLPVGDPKRDALRVAVLALSYSASARTARLAFIEKYRELSRRVR